MDALTVVALLLLVLLAAIMVYAAIALARWPGRIARERSHPQADAISVCAWLGVLFTAGVAWMVAMVWAHTMVPGES